MTVSTHESVVFYGDIFFPDGSPSSGEDTLSIGRDLRDMFTEESSPVDAWNLDAWDDGFVYRQLGTRIVVLMHLDSPANLKTRIGPAFQILHHLVLVQAEMSMRGRFLRGVVTVGTVMMEPDLLVGPGLERARVLHARLASYPRIVVDTTLLHAIAHEPLLRRHAAAEELQFLGNLLRRDTDGQWFVDYLRAMKADLDDPDSYLLLLDEHKAQLESQLAYIETRDLPRQEVDWLIEYHDHVVRDLVPGHSDRLAITADSDVEHLLGWPGSEGPSSGSGPRSGTAPGTGPQQVTLMACQELMKSLSLDQLRSIGIELLPPLVRSSDIKDPAGMIRELTDWAAALPESRLSVLVAAVKRARENELPPR